MFTECQEKAIKIISICAIYHGGKGFGKFIAKLSK